MLKNTKTGIITTALTVLFAHPAFAVKSGEQITDVLSKSASETSGSISIQSVESQPNSSVTLDFSLSQAQSWDSKDSPNNIKTNCFNGTAITGVEYNNVTIETVAGSFLSEAVIYFSDSASGDNGLRLVLGAGYENSGTQSFSSNGILDITDNGLSDVTSLSDGVFLTQFYEKIDDFSNTVDATYTGGTLTVHGIDLTATSNCMFIQGASSDISTNYQAIDVSEEYKIGDFIDFLVSVTNEGGAAATNVTLHNDLGAQLKLQSISCTDGVETTDEQVFSALSVADIAPAATLECTISTQLVSSGTIHPYVNVTADNDVNTSNNESGAVINGAFLVIPINNLYALLAFIMLIISSVVLTQRLRKD